MGAPVVHFEINARDGKRAQDFYSTLFDWKVNADNPMGYGVVDTGVKMGINGGVGQTEGDTPPNVKFYVQVEDLQAYLDRAERLGGRTVMPVTEIPNMVTMATFADLEGNIIGLVKGPQTPPKPKRAVRRKKPAARKKKATKVKRKKKRSRR